MFARPPRPDPSSSLAPQGGQDAAILPAGPVARPVRLAGEVYEILLKRLMALEIEPGDRISVDALVRELEVSQTPIREALGRLESQGLVVKVHLSGYRAAPQLTRKQFGDLAELRLLIEPAAAAKAAVLMSDEERDAIATIADSMGQRFSMDTQVAYNRFAEEDTRFHAAIAKASQNELYHDILVRQAVHVRLFRLRLSARVTTDALVEHARIIDAFHARDPDAVAAAMRTHLENAYARFVGIYDS
ncbi:GntR family transcriptional regulator [Gluconacetobacter azotocaptans]|uniref:GntR family transcriptional regulator n=1 Tax=Gluconacetobacter azotocaptans TaxID=142834 RepID=A0A7W4JQ06_9PROT|nr:GntR family transcriptional regulator [Gluconacetobacter azotocaptans]MBB2188784.1 GntR family transcriptional regulator [Gluconacetobacter azotocaptans]MBM9402590.1 GntR family transcriptional regulator [Gluconacetobacter azotocaptans]